MSSNRAHEEESNYQVIVYGLSIVSGDDINSEIEKALPFLNPIVPCKNEDIEWVDRFPTRSDDGTYPMIITFKDRKIPDGIWAIIKEDQGKYPWYQRSLARHIRRWNSKMDREAKRLNANVPDSEPTIWESKKVGDMKILRQVANPRYVQPAVTGGQASSSRRPQGPMFRRPNA